MKDERQEKIRVDTGASGVRTVNAVFPSNSYGSREGREIQTRKKIEKIVSGTVTKKKRSFLKRFSDVFFGDGVDSVCPYIIHDILIPAVKSTFSDTVRGGIDMLLFGDARGPRGGYGGYDRGRMPYVSYDSYSSGGRDRGRDRDERNRDRASRRNRANHNFDDILFESRREAEKVLFRLIDLIEKYDSACLADFYDLTGIEHSHTDRKYGWKNLRNANIIPVRGGGYMIDFPSAVFID